MQPQSCCPAPSVFTIFLGDAKTMSLKAAYAETGDPVDLTSCTAIVVSLPAQAGAPLQLTLASGAVVISSPTNLGKFTAALTSVQSALLNVGELQNFDVTFTIGGNPFTVRYYQALTVLEND